MTHEENKMRYRTIVNDKVVYESYFAVNPMTRVLWNGYTIFLLVIIGLAIAFQDVERMIGYTFCLCVSQIAFYVVRKKDCKNLMEKFIDIYRNDAFEGEVIFEEDKVRRYLDMAPESVLEIKYSEFKKFYRLKHYYLLTFTDQKNEQFYNGVIAIDRADLQKQSEEMLIEVVREKMPQVGTRILKKK